jgi:quercetin dioxygenase-like cupin family protein
LPGAATLLGSAVAGRKHRCSKRLPDKTLKAGDSHQTPAGVVHAAKAHRDKSLKVLGICVVDKTKPLASPAP